MPSPDQLDAVACLLATGNFGFSLKSSPEGKLLVNNSPRGYTIEAGLGDDLRQFLCEILADGATDPEDIVEDEIESWKLQLREPGEYDKIDRTWPDLAIIFAQIRKEIP